MKKYITPETKIVYIEKTDVITASGYEQEKGVGFEEIFQS